MPLLAPLGGTLVDLTLTGPAAATARHDAESLPAVTLSAREACDLEMLAIGAFSPLRGFMGAADFRAVCRDMRLADGTPWSIPVTLCPPDDVAARIQPGRPIALRHPDGTLLALMDVTETYPHDIALEIPNVYGTDDNAHPGVALVRAQGRTAVAGPIRVITANPHPEFADARLTPAQTRAAFDKRGWATVVAFQTRNPIHRAHEYLTKCAQESVDGLLIHPVVGETKSDDIPADVRMACYRTLVERYYNPAHTLLAVMPLAMRYAGPREAVLHALIRRNYGCSHFIVGRDHAGVGNYYGTYDAQKIFDRFTPAEIGIAPVKFEHTFWDRKLGGMASPKTTPFGPEDRVALSGTKVRDMLKAGQRPPEEFTRPEIADILIKWAQSVG